VMIPDGRKRKPTAASLAELFAPRAPFRAEVPAESFFFDWRLDVLEAMDDARSRAPGSRVISHDGKIMARFDNNSKDGKPHLRRRRSATSSS